MVALLWSHFPRRSALLSSVHRLLGSFTGVSFSFLLDFCFSLHSYSILIFISELLTLARYSDSATSCSVLYASGTSVAV